MRSRWILVGSLLTVTLGASELFGSMRQEEGYCVWTLNTSRPCEEYDLVEECDYHVLSECHSVSWQVTQATCVTGTQQISCRASWQEP